MIDKIRNIFTIAAKDIRDGYRNRMVLSILLAALVMLLLPKWLGSMLAPPSNEVLLYDPGTSEVSQVLENHGYTVIHVNNEADLTAAVQQGVALFGLAVPENFSQQSTLRPQPEIQAYILWQSRGNIRDLQSDLETTAPGLGRIDFSSSILYPQPDTFSMLGLSFLTMLVVVLLVGISLVPAMIFEEKRTKTLDALLVSPATEAQLVAAKALVGMFYTFLVAALLFGLNWRSVVHWELAVLFTLLCGLFSISFGLVIGSFYERQQDVSGLINALVLVFVGGVFVRLVDLSVPTALGALLDWLPSTCLFRLLQQVFYQHYTWADLLPGLLITLAVSALLYSLVVWRLRRSGR